MTPGVWRIVAGARLAHCFRDTPHGAMQSLCGAVHMMPTLLKDRIREPHCKHCQRIADRAAPTIETFEQ